MNELSKINAEHLRRCAIVYVRQSSTTQVEHNRESTARQYDLAERAAGLGWRRDQVKVIVDKQQLGHGPLDSSRLRKSAAYSLSRRRGGVSSRREPGGASR